MVKENSIKKHTFTHTKKVAKIEISKSCKIEANANTKASVSSSPNAGVKHKIFLLHDKNNNKKNLQTG